MINNTDWLYHRIDDEIFSLPLGIFFLKHINEHLSFLPNSLPNNIGLFFWWKKQEVDVYRNNFIWSLNSDEITYLQSITVFEWTSDFNFALCMYAKNNHDTPSITNAQLALLGDHQIFISGGHSITVPHFIPILVEERADLKAAFDLLTFHGILSFITWWDASGYKEYPKLSQYLESQSFNLSQILTSPHQIFISGGHSITVPHFIPILVEERADLKAAFDSDSRSNQVPIVVNVSKNNLPNINVDDIDAIKINNYGINIIGLSEYSLGIGEDARMAKQVVEYLNIPSLSVAAPILCTSNKLTNPSVGSISSKNYAIDLFCLPPTDMIRLNFEGGKDLLNRNSYKIGAWPWELPFWPVPLEKIANFADEIWAQSEYVFNCFSRLKNTPIYRMPMVVEIGNPKRLNRTYLNLKNDTFIFYTLFDGNSRLSRKNPLASVLAFQIAFKNKRDANVSLVIKAMNTSSDNEEWRKIKTIANNDSRITIINKYLDKDSLLNLMATFDAFISLHRSEGFGRVIAEAMLLGQPVITSNFSGNLDFCNQDTSYLVDGHLVGVKKNEYPFSDGQYWFEPDINIAANQIIKAYENSPETLRISQNAKRYINTNYSIQSASIFYKNRLSSIANKI